MPEKLAHLSDPDPHRVPHGDLLVDLVQEIGDHMHHPRDRYRVREEPLGVPAAGRRLRLRI
eukprot:4537129-Lingulodinium_polyedra.AAC.1